MALQAAVGAKYAAVAAKETLDVGLETDDAVDEVGFVLADRRGSKEAAWALQRRGRASHKPAATQGRRRTRGFGTKTRPSMEESS